MLLGSDRTRTKRAKVAFSVGKVVPVVANDVPTTPSRPRGASWLLAELTSDLLSADADFALCAYTNSALCCGCVRLSGREYTTRVGGHSWRAEFPPDRSPD